MFTRFLRISVFHKNPFLIWCETRSAYSGWEGRSPTRFTAHHATKVEIIVESMMMAESHQRLGLRQLEKWLPSPNPCHIPILLYPGYLTPAIGLHIDTAQDGGKPMLLNYIGPGLGVFNRRQVCTDAVRNSMRPLSCDEYPFASTVQGGFGASTSPVPGWEQVIQGLTLLDFYSTKLPRPFLPLTPFAVVVNW